MFSCTRIHLAGANALLPGYSWAHNRCTLDLKEVQIEEQEKKTANFTWTVQASHLCFTQPGSSPTLAADQSTTQGGTLALQLLAGELSLNVPTPGGKL